MKPIDLAFNSLFARTKSAYVCIYSYEQKCYEGTFDGNGGIVFDDCYWVLKASYCETVYYEEEDKTTYNYNNNTATVTISGTTYGGSGGGSTTSPTPSPFDEEELIKINAVKSELNLKPLLYDNWINSHASTVFEIYYFGVANMWSDEATMFAKNAIDAMMADQDLIFDYIYVVDAADPDKIITNMADYLKCFDTTKNASLTIYVNEPINGTDYLLGRDRVGHTFVSIKQGSSIATYGFYPVNGISSLVHTGVDGVMEDNSNTEYDVSLTINNISPSRLQAIISLSISYSISDYSIEQRNCTDMGIDLGNLAGLPIPECNANPIYFFGSTPGNLGEYIRNLSLPNGVTRNINGGNSPSNNCN